MHTISLNFEAWGEIVGAFSQLVFLATWWPRKQAPNKH